MHIKILVSSFGNLSPKILQPKNLYFSGAVFGFIAVFFTMP